MAKFCMHEKHGGVCNLTGEYCSLGPFPNEDIEEFIPVHHRLTTNGVTVQEWISVKDRFPEVVSIHKGHRGNVKKSIRVLCVCVQKSGKTMVKEGYCELYNDYPEPRWQIPGTIDKVTHWQYLPQPPKVV